MADFAPLIETMEHRWMRAWIQGDRRTMKKLVSSDFRLLIGSKPSVILDAPSWMEALAKRYTCTSYRFGDVYVRRHGPVALFASQLDLEAKLDGKEWSGQAWITDLWQKTRLKRNWRMIERVISRIEDNPDVSAAVRSMQLWR
jgi:hypothetical protein